MFQDVEFLHAILVREPPDGLFELTIYICTKARALEQQALYMVAVAILEYTQTQGLIISMGIVS